MRQPEPAHLLRNLACDASPAPSRSDRGAGWRRAGLCALGLLAACAGRQPLDSAGLPRVSRYTNAAQLDWMLSRFTIVAQEAAAAGQAERLTQACLGWERTTFDVESLRRYPVVIRMSVDGAALSALPDELAGAVGRHPLPPACQPRSAPVAAAQASAADAAPVPVPVNDASAAATDVAVAPRALPPAGQEVPGPMGPGAQAAVPPISASAQMEDRVGQERALLQQLRQAVSGAAVDEPVLTTLARSDIPSIRLRARFHLLGQCANQVDAHDRYPTATGACIAATPGELPRRTQARLLKDLLRAWSVRYIEPMSDMVLALANYVARDNPAVDGPRVSR